MSSVESDAANAAGLEGADAAAVGRLRDFMSAHHGPGVAVISYLGRVGARIVVVADDGAFGDAVASGVEAATDDRAALVAALSLAYTGLHAVRHPAYDHDTELGAEIDWVTEQLAGISRARFGVALPTDTAAPSTGTGSVSEKSPS